MVVGKVFVKWVLCKIRQNHVKAFSRKERFWILWFLFLVVPGRKERFWILWFLFLVVPGSRKEALNKALSRP